MSAKTDKQRQGARDQDEKSGPPAGPRGGQKTEVGGPGPHGSIDVAPGFRCWESNVDSKTKVKEVSDEALLASVKQEMAEPRTCESAREQDKKQSHAKSRKPVR